MTNNGMILNPVVYSTSSSTSTPVYGTSTGPNDSFTTVRYEDIRVITDPYNTGGELFALAGIGPGTNAIYTGQFGNAPAQKIKSRPPLEPETTEFERGISFAD